MPNSVNETVSVAPQADTALAITYLVTSAGVMLANGVIVFVIVKSKQLHLATLWMITIMAAFDFLMGLYYFIFVVPSAFLNRFAYSDKMIGLASCLSTLLTGQTIFNIALTVLDRYIAVTRPLSYIHIVTTKRFLAVVAVTFILNVCRLLIIVLPDVDYYYNSDIALCVADFNTLPTVLASIGFPVITLIVIVGSSCRMYFLIKRDKCRVLPSTLLLLPQNRVRFPKMVVLAATVFCVSYVPFLVSVIWNLADKKENIPVPLVKLTAVALLSNSLWNVFIYNTTYRPFREALAYLFCRSYFRQQKQTEIYSHFKTERK